ncbi:hypothetical protein BV25DRAFT_966234 [Artomyces pyxidatus]|uniref:Uncharacterized protein n=1 Tax=Artomyces pyxidatus TaxID=48021 RepID=A0ACB8SXA6_9AGAM|nr:hypothetical protein BV25DRAFT_966234 [Artomyces pyxidatus]
MILQKHFGVLQRLLFLSFASRASALREEKNRRTRIELLYYAWGPCYVHSGAQRYTTVQHERLPSRTPYTHRHYKSPPFVNNETPGHRIRDCL